ncbi:hypothetical protein G5I_12712 [Acromyrmex echinatior]|uniref:Uncharacterized protein n=1 Tax=Acromyrmex echinatior TaxID=103372 RepID=F4X322_ACREC|nr:hypothetical protein G5I_12712 [Acromyrmex echinatior]
MSTQAYYKERLGFDPADTVAEHQREQRSQHGYEESLSKFKGQNANGFPEEGPGCNGEIGEHRAGNTQAFWGCWAMFIEAHDERDAIQKKTFTKWVNKHLKKLLVLCYRDEITKAYCHFMHKAVNHPMPKDLRFTYIVICARRHNYFYSIGEDKFIRCSILHEAHKSTEYLQNCAKDNSVTPVSC